MGNDFDELYPPFDDNMVYASVTLERNRPVLFNVAKYESHNTPLWLGETGENSNPWYYETRQLAEQHEIGWNWWTHKKLETTRAPLSSPSNENYEKLSIIERNGLNLQQMRLEEVYLDGRTCH